MSQKTFHKNFRIFSSLSTPSAGIIDRSIRRGIFSMAGQMFSKNNFKNLFLLFFIICQFGAIVSDSHIWDWGVYLALNILIVLYVYLRPGEARTKSSQQKLLIAVLIHTAVIISTLWRAYRVSFIMDIFFDILDFWAIWGFILILKFGLSKR